MIGKGDDEEEMDWFLTF